MSDYSYQDLTDLFGVYDESAQTPINTLNKMLSISGNPLFMYLTGVMSPDDLRNTVQMATWEPVDISDADYYVMDEMNAGDPVLMVAYQAIRQGVSINAAMRSMLDAYNREAQKNPQMANDPQSRALYLEYALADITEYKRKWDNAQNIKSKYDSGEYVEGANGTVLKRMDPTKAADVLKQMGMPYALQNPFVWEVVPDANLLAVAASHDERALRALSPFAHMIDPATGMLVQREAKKIAKKATSTAQSVYEEILGKTPEGREYLKQVTTGKTQAEKRKDTAGALVKGPLLNMSPLLKAATRGVGGEIVGGAAESGADDYWAKLGASYAGRAEQERLMKPINTAKERAMSASAEANKYRQGAINRGTVPAISLLNQTFPFAAVLSQTGAPQVRIPSMGGVNMAPTGGSSADYLKWALQDPRVKGMTPQQIDLFSTYFAKTLGGR